MNAGQSQVSPWIAAHSKRRAMDWSLVLASQEIPATIVRTEDAGWGLLVEPADYERALEAIRLYRSENRKWSWKRPIPGIEETFHWGGFAWCFLLIWVHWLTTSSFFALRETAQMDSAKVAHGEWWRIFSAMLLHADLRHLLANTTIGSVLIGLALARYGAAWGLTLAYLAGAFGNLAGLFFYSKHYFGMGASGMIMGALGLLAVPPLHGGIIHPHGKKQILQAASASVMLFVLVGVDPNSDLVAHLGGFLAGALLAVGFNALPSDRLLTSRMTAIVWIIFLTLLLGTSALAIRAAGGR